MPAAQQIIQDQAGRERTENSREELLWEAESGVFRGWEDRMVRRAQGIRYAVSERYGPPRAFSCGEGVFSATSPAPVPAQNDSPIEAFLTGTHYARLPQEESAQYLSIALPKGASARDRLPVMVWIPGGAFRNGGIDIVPYNTELLAAEQGVIIVSLQYRLGCLGFLRDRQGNPANLGLLDLIEGLKWISRNIACFGGDPGNITLFGHSAGASAVLHLMICTGAEGLFRRAIIQSCPFGVMKGRTGLEREMLRSFMELPADAPLEEILRRQSVICSARRGKGNAKYMPFAPRYGVPPLPPQNELDAAWARACGRIDVLLGANQREAALYLGLNKHLCALAGMPLARGVMERVIQIKSREIFLDGTEEFYERHCGRNSRMHCYRLTWGMGESIFGASHAVEMSLLFGAGNYAGSPLLLGKTAGEIDGIGRQVRKVWADFAKTGSIGATEINGVLKIRRRG